jgi:hypothetical protein
MARKFLRDTDSEPVFYTLIGISCHLKDYRLSYLLNKKLEAVFSKQQDLVITLQDKTEPATFSFYHFQDDEQFNVYLLIANRSEEYVLLPEFRQLDFLLMVEGEFKKSRKDQLLKAVSSIPNVLKAHEINITTIRNYRNLLSDIEIHLMNIFRKPKTKFEPQLKM